jgi:DNA-binding GntR family transcriptional regulator
MKLTLRRLRVRLSKADAPAHAAIEEGLAEAIAIGELASGERLPAERELAERVGVSRMTLRQALGSLERRGLVERRVGRRGGTFVAEPKIERDLTALAGLTAQLRRQGHRAGARVISAEEGPAGVRTARVLGVDPGAGVFRVVRVRLSDDQPLALERSLFPAARFPGLLEGPLDGSLYDVLEERYGDRPVRAVESLEPVVAGAAEAELLEVKEGAPLLLVERTAYNRGGVAVEYARDVFRGDRTRVVVESAAALQPAVAERR